MQFITVVSQDNDYQQSAHTDNRLTNSSMHKGSVCLWLHIFP